MVSDKRNFVAASVDRGVDDESTSNRDIQHVYERRRNRRINPHTDIIPPSFNILSQPLDILSSVASMVPESQNFSDSNEPVVFRKKTTTLKKRSSAVDDQPLLRKRRRLYKNNRPVGQITDLVPPNFNLLSQATVDSVPNPTKKPSVKPASVKRPASMGRCRVGKDLPNVFKTRSSPSGLFNLVQQLNDAQRSAVKAIGFGDLLSLGIYRCPVQFSRHVNMFDFRRMSLVLSRGEEILIEEEDVQCILNIPRGQLEVEESVGTSLDDPSYHQFLKDWRRRWGIQKDIGAPITTTMPKKILENKDGDNNFKIDFMVYVVSSFLWSNQSTQCRFKILKSFMDVEMIKDLNWCRFTLNAVSDGVQKWKNYTGSYFQGPLTLLLMNSVKAIEKDAKGLKAKLSEDEMVDKSLVAKIVEQQGKVEQLKEQMKQLKIERDLSCGEASKELNNVKMEMEARKRDLDSRQSKVEALVAEMDVNTVKCNSVKETGEAKRKEMLQKCEEIMKSECFRNVKR